MTIPKEMLRGYIQEENFKSTSEVMAAIKGLFAEVVQGVMEAELEMTLGYEKQARRATSGGSKDGFHGTNVSSGTGIMADNTNPKHYHFNLAVSFAPSRCPVRST